MHFSHSRVFMQDHGHGGCVRWLITMRLVEAMGSIWDETWS